LDVTLELSPGGNDPNTQGFHVAVPMIKDKSPLAFLTSWPSSSGAKPAANDGVMNICDISITVSGNDPTFRITFVQQFYEALRDYSQIASALDGLAPLALESPTFNLSELSQKFKEAGLNLTPATFNAIQTDSDDLKKFIEKVKASLNAPSPNQ
jgi:hypothetical protein